MVAIQALQDGGFRTTDTGLVFAFDLRQQSVPTLSSQAVIRPFQDRDLQPLVELAREAYSLDRFHADPHLPTAKVDDLHAEWIRSSCLGKVADSTIVAELDNVTVGFTTCRLHPGLEQYLGYRRATLVLSAVAPKARGQGSTRRAAFSKLHFSGGDGSRPWETR